MIRMYNQQAAPTSFMAGLFQSPKGNMHNSAEVEIDVVRGQEDVSIAIQDLSVGYRANANDIYSNKSFVPPIHKESIALNSHDLIKRTPGQDSFEDPDFRGNVIARAFMGAKKVERKIRRAMELQASQVMQTGTVTLTDSAGVSVYAIDYKPKATHLPDAGVAWASATGKQMMGDIDALADVIRGNGLADANQLIFGDTAFQNFINAAQVQALYDNRRIVIGTVPPMEMRGGGGKYRGTIEIGNYSYDMWTYNGRYTHPQTGVSTPFMTPTKVIVRVAEGRLDASFGAIPNIGAELGIGSGRLLRELPSRISNTDGGMDMSINVWLTENGEQLFVGVGSRPLMIPTAIDTFGCIDTAP
ncbi:MAG: hypothetical protein DRP01_08295 [Archaeoglobales archaeon]|nr:MAG: hypothetical protein DRP01_08295 [Archaeoglobales archaeon]